MNEPLATPPTSPRNVPGGRRDRNLGFGILSVAFLGALAISWVASQAIRPAAPRTPKAPTTEGIPGFPARVSATSILELARGLTPRTELLGIVIKQVGPEGSVDLSKPGNLIRYAFGSRPGEGPPPSEELAQGNRIPFCGRQDVVIDHRGILAKKDRAHNPCVSTPPEALPSPVCGPQEVWSKALEKGWKADRPAKLEYFRALGGPAWRLTGKSEHQTLVLYGDCERELSGRDAQGVVPG